jgi:hypothetical protein
MSIRTALAFCFAALVLAAAAASAEEAPAKAWDQAAVSALAGKLAKAADELYAEYYRTPGSSGGPIGSGQSRESYQLKYKLRRIEESTKQLAGALAAGKGRDETMPEVEDIGVLARDVRELAARMFIQSPLQARADTARGLWRELLPYYGIAPPPDR